MGVTDLSEVLNLSLLMFAQGAKSFHEAMQAASKTAKQPSAMHLNTVSEGAAADSAAGGGVHSSGAVDSKEPGDSCQGSAPSRVEIEKPTNVKAV